MSDILERRSFLKTVTTLGLSGAAVATFTGCVSEPAGPVEVSNTTRHAINHRIINILPQLDHELHEPEKLYEKIKEMKRDYISAYRER
jgi:hypothetical protein